MRVKALLLLCLLLLLPRLELLRQLLQLGYNAREGTEWLSRRRSGLDDSTKPTRLLPPDTRYRPTAEWTTGINYNNGNWQRVYSNLSFAVTLSPFFTELLRSTAKLSGKINSFLMRAHRCGFSANVIIFPDLLNKILCHAHCLDIVFVFYPTTKTPV